MKLEENIFSINTFNIIQWNNIFSWNRPYFRQHNYYSFNMDV